MGPYTGPQCLCTVCIYMGPACLFAGEEILQCIYDERDTWPMYNKELDFVKNRDVVAQELIGLNRGDRINRGKKPDRLIEQPVAAVNTRPPKKRAREPDADKGPADPKPKKKKSTTLARRSNRKKSKPDRLNEAADKGPAADPKSRDPKPKNKKSTTRARRSNRKNKRTRRLQPKRLFTGAPPASTMSTPPASHPVCTKRSAD